MNITTEYAALTYGSTPENSRYVLCDGVIVGAVLQVRDGSGQWRAYEAGDLLDLRRPTTHDSRGAAIDSLTALANREPLYPELERMAHAVEAVFVDHPPEDKALAIVAGARAMRDYDPALDPDRED